MSKPGLFTGHPVLTSRSIWLVVIGTSLHLTCIVLCQRDQYVISLLIHVVGRAEALTGRTSYPIEPPVNSAIAVKIYKDTLAQDGSVISHA